MDLLIVFILLFVEKPVNEAFVQRPDAESTASLLKSLFHAGIEMWALGFKASLLPIQHRQESLGFKAETL